MKSWLRAWCVALTAVLTLFSFSSPVLADGTGTINQLNPWKISGSNIVAASSTAGLKIPSLANQNCLGTDGSGIFGAGTCSGGGGAWPFTKGLTNFGTSTQATTTPEWFKLGLFASSTSQLVFASTTAISATTVCLIGDTCRTTWPTGTGNVFTSGGDVNHRIPIWTTTGGSPPTVDSDINLSFSPGGSSGILNAPYFSAVSGVLSPAFQITSDSNGPYSALLANDATGIVAGTTTPTARYFIATSTLKASSLPLASTTALTATTLCLTGDTCRTTWPTGGTGVWPLTPSTNFGVAVQATTTPEWFQNGLHASSTNQFVNENIWGVLTLKATTSAMLGADASGNVIGETLSGGFSLSANTLSNVTYHSFTYATSTWTGTTTLALETGYGEVWNSVRCFTNVGTVNVQAGYGSASTTMFNASTTNGTMTLSSNNTMTAGNKVVVDLGTPASGPTSINCTYKTTL